VLLARVARINGEGAIERLLGEASCERTAAYLGDIANWISYREMIGLWEAAATVTGEPEIARHAGEDAVRQLGSSATSVVLRGLGSPEELLRQVGTASRRFSTVAELETVEVRPGFAEVRASANPGFVRHPLHCEWTRGMLSQCTVLFGLEPANVEHSICQGAGAADCRYLISWESEVAGADLDPGELALGLERQLEAMSERLSNVFATATDLISSADLDDILARITERAGLQVRAPRYLLAVRPDPDSGVHRHQKGLSDEEGLAVAERVLAPDPGVLPDHWLCVPVASQRNRYGWLVAMYEPGTRFFPQERELLEVYARYAATALDSASALSEARARQHDAQQRYEESHALLELARRLATAESSEAVAARMAEAVPAVIDCDRVSVYVWEEETGEFARQAVGGPDPGDDRGALQRIRPATAPRLAALLAQPDPEPFFIELDQLGPEAVLSQLALASVVVVPITTERRLLGCLVVSVREDPERLAPSQELGNRLSGVAAHAVTALENGRLVDRITHQARHDHLTGLLNRMGFKEALTRANRRALEGAESLALFFLDLDGFKAINDELGHEAGDRLLGAVGRRLEARLRPSDTAARLGGDEFAVIAEGVGGETESARIEARLLDAFEEPFNLRRERVVVRVSIGRAIWPLDVGDPEELLRAADAAMYGMKRRKPGGRASRA
jgi:diguanylate cyclase (GGDEF)-like protein